MPWGAAGWSRIYESRGVVGLGGRVGFIYAAGSVQREKGGGEGN